MTMHELERSVELQRQGVVVIGCLLTNNSLFKAQKGSHGYNDAQQPQPRRPGLPITKEFIKGASMLSEIPGRVSAFHRITDNPTYERYNSVLRVLSPKEHRLRSRSHFGSITEIRYALSSFGICMNESDITETALQHRLQNYIVEHQRQERAELEESIRSSYSSDSGFVGCPRANDILLGKGRSYQDYSGNLRLSKEILPKVVARYRLSEGFLDKSLVTMDVLEDLKAEGCRFLKQTEGGWQIEEGPAPQVKVSQVVRRLIRDANSRKGAA